MTTNAVTEVLSASLSPDWTIEGLAEQFLSAIISQEGNEFTLDATQLTNRQAQRLIRPLLAYLANLSAAESGKAVNIYEGELLFKRTGTVGPVRITGQFENKPGCVRLSLRKFEAPELSEDLNRRHISATPPVSKPVTRN